MKEIEKKRKSCITELSKPHMLSLLKTIYSSVFIVLITFAILATVTASPEYQSKKYNIKIADSNFECSSTKASGSYLELDCGKPSYINETSTIPIFLFHS